MKTKNAFKACAVFIGVIFVLYGTKNVRGGFGGGGEYTYQWPQDRPPSRALGLKGSPVDLSMASGGGYAPPSQADLSGSGGGGIN